MDLPAIRKNHGNPKPPSETRRLLRNCFLIQVKGVGARRADKSDIKRLREVARYYKARDVVLAEWVKRSHFKFYLLVNSRTDPKKAWSEVDPGVLFR